MFKHGAVQESVAVLDANSMYPYVMAAEAHPHKLIAYFEEGSKRVLYQALRRYWCVADVDLAGGHPPLPMSTTKGPVSLRSAGRAVLCGQELAAARDAACITTVRRLAVYEVADLFSGYVGYLYPRKLAARQAGNEAEADFYKLLLNGLYGKFAQKGVRWKDDETATAGDRYAYWYRRLPCSGRLQRCRRIGGVGQVLEEGHEPRNSFPAIAAGITAASRTELQRTIDLAGESNCLYCDTDSIHTTARGRARLDRAGACHPARLGGWKEEAVGPDAYYWGQKHYRVGDLWTCNYLAASAREIAHGTFLQDSYSGLETILATGTVDRVTVQERQIQLPAGTWSHLRRRLVNGSHHCGHQKEYRATPIGSSSLSSLQKDLLG